MANTQVVGLQPALPWFLGRSAWWNDPVRAERLATLRIGIGLVLLWDVLFTYLPLASVFFGEGSLGSPEVFVGRQAWWRWSALRGISSPAVLQSALVLWAVAAALLTAGIAPRLAAAFCWLMSVSVIGANYYIHNSGDNVRSIALLYLMLTPCGAVWSLGGRPRGQADSPVLISPWALRLLLIQLACIYFLNGVYKFAGGDWRGGGMLHSVLGNLAWTRFSPAQVPIPFALTQVMTWTVLVWELLFPLLMAVPWARAGTLWLGVGFHLGTAALLQLGPFPFYMLCLYLPLVPWERYLEMREAAYREKRAGAAAERKG